MGYINESNLRFRSLVSGVLQVVKSIKAKSKDKVVYSEKGEDYQFSKLEQSNYVVLDGFAWQQKLENISRGMLSELLWCVNHRIPMFLAYKSANGLDIYGTEIDDNLNFKGVAGTADNFYKILDGQFGSIVADDSIFLKGGFTLSDVGNVYLKGEAFVDPLDYLNIEVQPTSYFY